MNEKRKSVIQRMVREAIVYYLERDLDGNELLMKEVWENVRSDEEEKVAKDELRHLIELVRPSTAS